MSAFDMLQEPAFWAHAIVLATPLLFGILGAQLCRRAGVVNLGAEGLFIAGALAGYAAARLGLQPWPGVAVAAATGMLIGAPVGALAGPRGPAQPLTGLAATLLVAALAVFAMRILASAPVPLVSPFPPVQIPKLSALPYVGEVLFAQTPLVYLAVGAALVLAYILARLPLGLAIRAYGDNPQALTALGRSAFSVRMFAVMLGSALMAVGGVCLTLGAATPFTPGMAHGRGWLCVAIALAVGPRMTLALAAALLFGTIDAVQQRLVASLHLSSDLVAMLPYALVLIALAAIGRRGGATQATVP
jgi:general nucleoside transport system permease protein